MCRPPVNFLLNEAAFSLDKPSELAAALLDDLCQKISRDHIDSVNQFGLSVAWGLVRVLFDCAPYKKVDWIEVREVWNPDIRRGLNLRGELDIPRAVRPPKMRL